MKSLRNGVKITLSINLLSIFIIGAISEKLIRIYWNKLKKTILKFLRIAIAFM